MHAPHFHSFSDSPRVASPLLVPLGMSEASPGLEQISGEY